MFLSGSTLFETALIFSENANVGLSFIGFIITRKKKHNGA